MLNMTAALKLAKWILTVWRFKAMMKHTMNVAKGIGMGGVGRGNRGGGQQQGNERRPSQGQPHAEKRGQGHALRRQPDRRRGKNAPLTTCGGTRRAGGESAAQPHWKGSAVARVFSLRGDVSRQGGGARRAGGGSAAQPHWKGSAMTRVFSLRGDVPRQGGGTRRAGGGSAAQPHWKGSAVARVFSLRGDAPRQGGGASPKDPFFQSMPGRLRKGAPSVLFYI